VSPVEAVAILLAGVAAGAVNTIVGSGTLLTFPLLVAFGYPPITANVTSTVGLAPGGISGAFGYRRELRGQTAELPRLLVTAAVGAITGAVLLLALPSEAFDVIVPVFIAVAVLLILAKPRLSRLAEAARGRRAHRVLGRAGVYGTSVYGGYFGAGQGVLFLAVLGLTIPGDLQQTNALKNALAGAVNVVAALIFIFSAVIAWGPVAMLATGSVAGGQLGAFVGRRMGEERLRMIVVAVGTLAFIQLTFG
jgi:uncharacterized membrane protein YfcA